MSRPHARLRLGPDLPLRAAGPRPRGGPDQFPDYLGIYIKAQHHSYTGLILNTTTFTKSVISPLEPQSYATL